MSKTIEQHVHEFDAPQPAVGGEDFDSYLHRVVYAAHLSGAAWAITNGPQVQHPAPGERGGPVEPVPDPTFDNPITVDGQPAEERYDNSKYRAHDQDEDDEHEHPEDVGGEFDNRGKWQQPGAVQRSA